MEESKPSGQGENMPACPTFTKEGFLAHATAMQEKLRQTNPDLDLKLTSGAWQPLFDFNTVMNESVPRNVNDQAQAATKEFMAADYSREAFDKFATNVRLLLAEQPEALQLVESIILKNPIVWDKMHEHAVAKRETEKHTVPEGPVTPAKRSSRELEKQETIGS